MLNKEVISVSIPALALNEFAGRALDIMADFRISHLPVVADKKLAGLVSEDDLLNVNADTLLGGLQHTFSNIVAHGNTHFLESVQLVTEFNLSVIPVVDGESDYLGAISLSDLARQTGKMIGASEPGAVIVLEMDRRNFSFSEISKLVETNDAQITQLNTSVDVATGTILITLKINKLEISDVIATFQRYEYKVKYYFGEELYENELRSNYDHLMNYLNI